MPVELVVVWRGRGCLGDAFGRVWEGISGREIGAARENMARLPALGGGSERLTVLQTLWSSISRVLWRHWDAELMLNSESRFLAYKLRNSMSKYRNHSIVHTSCKLVTEEPWLHDKCECPSGHRLQTHLWTKDTKPSPYSPTDAAP